MEPNAVLWCCRAVLDDLETMWQAASSDNRRMLETVRRSDRKLQQHLSQCRRRLPLADDNLIIAAAAADDDRLDDHLDSHTDYDVWLHDRSYTDCNSWIDPHILSTCISLESHDWKFNPGFAVLIAATCYVLVFVSRLIYVLLGAYLEAWKGGWIARTLPLYGRNNCVRHAYFLSSVVIFLSFLHSIYFHVGASTWVFLNTPHTLHIKPSSQRYFWQSFRIVIAWFYNSGCSFSGIVSALISSSATVCFPSWCR